MTTPALTRPPKPSQADLDRLGAIAQRAVRTIARQLDAWTGFVNRTSTRLREEGNTPVKVAAVSATYRVRASLDPAYSAEADLGTLVRSVVRNGTDDPAVRVLTLPHRCEVAVSALGGWLLTHPGPDPAWDRTIGGTRIEFRPVYRYTV